MSCAEERRADLMRHLLAETSTGLRQWLVARGQAEYRARQIERWVFRGRGNDFEEMTDLPAGLRAELAGEFRLWTSRVVAEHTAEDRTEKLLLELADGGTIECVLLRDGPRRTVCVSTQVGCAMGCVFCASGLGGVDRNLRSGEILEQMLRLARRLPAEERLSHIVVMGMGEPLANLDQLLPALERAASPHGLGISARRITISTVGLPPAMDRLAAHEPHFHLAVSLHAPDDELRDRLVPVNRKIGLAAIVSAADRYFQISGRRLTFEYVLLADLNDRPEHARQLASCCAAVPRCSTSSPTTRWLDCPTAHPRPGPSVAFGPCSKRRGSTCSSASAKVQRSTPLAVSSGGTWLEQRNFPPVLGLKRAGEGRARPATGRSPADVLDCRHGNGIGPIGCPGETRGG